MSTAADYKKAKKQLMELLEGKGIQAINIVNMLFSVLDKADKGSPLRLGIIEEILREIRYIPNVNMPTLLMLVSRFKKGEVAQVTDEAYNELATDLRKRLTFEFYSFFLANKIDFSFNPRDYVFEIVLRGKKTNDRKRHAIRLFFNITNPDIDYLIEIRALDAPECFTNDVFEDVEKCLVFLKKYV